jgi:2-methylaconitate cis-trans-isomerase PrpF
MFVPAAFYRGGTSKGLLFHARDLPQDRLACEQILLAALGSPDPYGRQLDGMGGGLSSLSKAAIIGASTRADADVDYTFVQIAVDQPVADWSNNCGNLSSAVGPFAVDEGLVDATDGEALVRIHQTNTGKLIHARFKVAAGRAETVGDYAIAGVAGAGARIRLDFLDPGGALTGRLLPTGRASDSLELGAGRRHDVSIVDATTLIGYVRAEALGLNGSETPDEIESRPGLMNELENLRRQVGVISGLADSPDKIGLQTPRIALVAPARDFIALDGRRYKAGEHDLTVRVLSMQRAHRALPGTAGLNLGVAGRIAGALPNKLARDIAQDGELRLANPSGVISVGASVRRNHGEWSAESAVLFRTARLLMKGEVAVPLA